MKRILLIALALITALLLVACQNKVPVITPSSDTDPGSDTNGGSNATAATPTNYVRFEMKNGGFFVVELLPDYAPETVANFQKLVSERYYDGVAFNWVVNEKNSRYFKTTIGTVNNGEIKGETSANTLTYDRGVVSMNALLNGGFSKEDLVIIPDLSTYSGKYAVFGKIVYGMDTVEAIVTTKTTSDDLNGKKTKPVVPQEIKSATFVEYSEDWAAN